MGIKTIRAAILANRGGLAEASDAEIMTIWNALPKEAQKQYQESLKTKGETKDAVGDKTKSNL